VNPVTPARRLADFVAKTCQQAIDTKVGEAVDACGFAVGYTSLLYCAIEFGVEVTANERFVVYNALRPSWLRNAAG
jgi:hypothetical protein